MSISVDSSLRPYIEALDYHERRTQVLARNLANAATPNYKARDLEPFAEVMHRTAGGPLPLRRTHDAHLPDVPADPVSAAQLRYRVPLAPPLDGNTVDDQAEYTGFAENAVRYQAALRFLDGKLRSLKLALKGE